MKEYKEYKVFGGVAQVGPGQVLQLSGEQIAVRAHNLELPEGYQLHAKGPKEKPPKPVPAIVKASALLSFKVGEVIGFEDLPSHLVGIAAPVGEPKSKVDEKAADVALLKIDPKAHKRKTEGQRAKRNAEKANAKKPAAAGNAR